MADPDEIESKTVEEVEEIMARAGIGTGAPATDDGGVEGGGGGTPEREGTDSGNGLEFIERMRGADNEVIANNFGQPIIEIIVSRDMEDEVRELIESWDTNPQGPSIFPQDPSFKEERPEVASDLTAFQFLLEDPQNLGSAGYDLTQIVDALEGEPVLYTKSNSARASLPL